MKIKKRIKQTEKRERKLRKWIEKTDNGFAWLVKTCTPLVKTLRQTFLSVPFAVAETLFAILIVALGEEVAGAVAFVALLCIKLVVCEDVFTTTLPFLLLCAFVTNCYDSFDLFIGYIVWAPLAVVCVLFHFIVYAKPVKNGESAKGIFAVTIAVMLGGIGRFSVMEYVKGAYYIFGLGAGMLVAYYLMKSQFATGRRYDKKERLSLIMTLWGCLCVAIVGLGYMKVALDWGTRGYSIGFSRNNISTMLMFAMPFPLFLGIKRKWLDVCTPLFFMAICATTSRGGVIFGGVEFIVCCVYWVMTNGKTARGRIIRACVCLAVSALVVLCVRGPIYEVLYERIFENAKLTEEARYKMLFQAWEKFVENPLLGTGLLDNATAYGEVKKVGAMGWYHMMIPQIFASMGLVGVAAYAYQGFFRIKSIFTKTGSWSLCLGISYLGILMMSQVNPGEFCPLPFELLTVLLFIFQELRLQENSLPYDRELLGQ